MHPVETQELVRELITETDHLSRTWHAAEQHTQSGRLAALRSTLQRLERHMGGELPLDIVRELDVVYQRIRAMASGIEDAQERADLEHLLAHAERLRPQDERPAFPLVRVIGPTRGLPARRLDVPSVALAAGAIALLVPLCVPRVRRSWGGWGVAAAVAASSMGAALAVRLRASSGVVRHGAA